MIALIILLPLFAFFLYAFIYWWIQVNNVEITLRAEGEAQQAVCRGSFDKMHKTIFTQAQVKDDYLNSFQDVYTAIMEGRYGNDKKADKSLMKFVKESNPEFSEKIFKQLMNTIDSQRNSFQYEQQKLINIDRQHKSFRKIFPNVIVLGSRSDLDMRIITSAVTMNSVTLQEENVVDIPLNTRKT